MIERVGSMFCDSGMSGKTCDGAALEPSTCSTTDDCREEEYCAENGMCLSNGACEQDEDCSNGENMFIMPACIGTVSCDAGMCGKTCDSVPVEETNGDPVVIDVTSCTSDADCLTIASERSVTGSYCSQGVCMKQGSCQSDTDCVNPSNVLW